MVQIHDVVLQIGGKKKMTCKDCVYAVQPTTTMRCRNHGIFMGDNAVVCNEFKGKPQTNADRHRAMTDEELARFIAYYGCPPNTNNCCPKEFAGEDETDCEACWLKWLKEEVEE